MFEVKWSSKDQWELQFPNFFSPSFCEVDCLLILLISGPLAVAALVRLSGCQMYRWRFLGFARAPPIKLHRADPPSGFAPLGRLARQIAYAISGSSRRRLISQPVSNMEILAYYFDFMDNRS